MSVPQWLLDLGIPERCIEKKSSARENKSTFSVEPLCDDIIWRVKIDGCWIEDNQIQRVDYLFWGQSAAGKKMVILVELKGKQFSTALKQIEQTLEFLCKRAHNNIIHTGKHQVSPGHDSHWSGGVRAYVIHSGGVRIVLHQKNIEGIRERYGVKVQRFPKKLPKGKGLDNLP